jgi:hypothetical protein
MKHVYAALLICNFSMFFGLFAMVDFNLEQTWDLGGTYFDYLTHLGNNKFYSVGSHSLEVFELSQGSLQKLQSFFFTDMTGSWHFLETRGDTLFLATQSANIHSFRILPDYSLEYLSEIPVQASDDLFEYTIGIWVDGNILVHCKSTYSSLNWDSADTYLDVYDITDLESPLLMYRHELSYEEAIIGIIHQDEGFYLVGMYHTLFYCEDYSQINRTNLLVDSLSIAQTYNTFMMHGKLHLLENNPSRVVRYSPGADHQLIWDSTILLPPNIQYIFSHEVEPDRVSFIGIVSGQDSFEWRLISYIPSDGAWTLEYDIPWACRGLIAYNDGYLDGAQNTLTYFDSNFNPLQTITNAPELRAMKVFKGRWVLFSESGIFGSQGLRIYDLQTEAWLDTQFIKYDIINSARHDSKDLCLYNDNQAMIFRLDDNGNHQFSTFDLGQEPIYALDVWDDTMVAITYSEDSEDWRLRAYDISSGFANELGILTCGGDYIHYVLFYDAAHFCFVQRDTPDPKLNFYRINDSGEISFIDSFYATGFMYLLQHDNRIITGSVDSPIFDVSDPDNPFVCMYTDATLQSGVAGCFISFDSDDNYLISQLIHNPSTIMDYQGVERDFFFSGYSFYIGPNRILMLSAGNLLEVSHENYTSVDDPSIPEPVNHLERPYPNPFSTITNIKVNFPGSEGARAEKIEQAGISIYNLKGQKVKSITLDPAKTGEQITYWDGRDADNTICSSVIYFVNLKVNGRNVSTRKLTFIK